jgi:O-antigen ligase
MSNTTTIYIVASCCGVLGLVAFVGLILVPAWGSYSRLWQRLAASFLSLYVLAALLGLGLAGAAGVLWLYDRFAA